MATKFFISSHFCKLIMQLVYVYLKIVLTFYVLCVKNRANGMQKTLLLTSLKR